MPPPSKVRHSSHSRAYGTSCPGSRTACPATPGDMHSRRGGHFPPLTTRAATGDLSAGDGKPAAHRGQPPSRPEPMPPRRARAVAHDAERFWNTNP
ncbi:hypothetical protein SFR_0524 [Streptomyces sp. FR-008]|nr:hypothetical protein SFR_0524 [Streptomyces sp. FR-008]